MTEYVIPDPNRVLLVDISKWQNDPITPQLVDFTKMKSLGVSGVILKAGQGLYADRDFFVNFEELWKVELPKGQYWYYDNRVDPKRQAEAWANIIQQAGDVGELGLWLDLEDRQDGVHKGWKNWYVMLETLKGLVPNIKIGIYTGYYYWVENTTQLGIPTSSLNYFAQYPLWIASYKTTSPVVPQPWTHYTVWQFTDLLDGKYYGAESFELDGNYFHGTLQDYQQYFGLGEYVPPIINPPGETVMEYECKVVWPLGCSTKLNPNTGGTNYFTWQPGTLFYASDIIRDTTDPNNADKLWAKLSRGVHAGKFVAVRYPSSSGNPVRAEYSQIEQPPPTGEVVRTHVIEVYSDGSIKVDGNSV